MLTVADVNLFLNTPKRAVLAVDWRPGLSKKEAQWWKWDSAIELDGMVPEGTRIVMHWRPAVGSAPDKTYLSLLYRDQRVYAIDRDEVGRHTNKIGIGRPCYRQCIDTPVHEHTWSDAGYGYAEPINPAPETLALLFDYFCSKTNLIVTGGFKPPPSQQFSLELI